MNLYPTCPVYSAVRAIEDDSISAEQCLAHVTQHPWGNAGEATVTPPAPYIAFYDDFTPVTWFELDGFVRDKSGRQWRGFSCYMPHVGSFGCTAEVVAARIYGALAGGDAIESEARFAVRPDDVGFARLGSPIIPYYETEPVLLRNLSLYLPTKPSNLEEAVALWRFLGMPTDEVSINDRNQLVGDHSYLDFTKIFDSNMSVACLRSPFFGDMTEYVCDTQKIQELEDRSRTNPRVGLIVDEIEAALKSHKIDVNDHFMSGHFTRIREFLGLKPPLGAKASD